MIGMTHYWRFPPCNVIYVNQGESFTLIISILIAVLTVFLTIGINQWISYNKSRRGLFEEIDNNINSRANLLLAAAQGIITEDPTKFQNQIITQLDKISLWDTAFQSFRQNGYLIKLPNEFSSEIKIFYMLSEVIMDKYKRDTDFQIILIQLPDDEESIKLKKRVFTNRLNNLNFMITTIKQYQDIHSRMVKYLEYKNTYDKIGDFFRNA